MIKNILVKDAGVKVFLYACSDCGSDNYVYLADSYSNRNAVGASCANCFETYWCDGRAHPILKQLYDPPVNSGNSYRAWRKKIIDLFLGSIGRCISCKTNTRYEFVTNKPLKEYVCNNCNKRNVNPLLTDVTSDHRSDLIKWLTEVVMLRDRHSRKTGNNTQE